MCYYTSVKTKANELAQYVQARLPAEGLPIGDFTAFEFPEIGIVTNEDKRQIQLANWGLLPHWADSSFNRVHTLNARIESLSEKASFKSYINQRCIFPVSYFYEWQWLDSKGKQKQQYEIGFEGKLFCLAGIWASRGNELSFSVVTTAANELMASIHNTKKRMPVVLREENRDYWLEGAPLDDFIDCNPDLTAKPINVKPIQLDLFS
jgi:putative SOS response-associated peptidase YedK